jgi:hypothetical protein
MPKKKVQNQGPPPESILERLDAYFSGKKELSFYTGLGCTIILSLLLFEPKVSIGGDDSMYINRAYNFLHHGTFPTFQGPLYPMVLSAFMYFAGINVVFFKFLSIAFLIGHFWFMYKLMAEYLSPFLLFVFLTLLGCSVSLLSYGSTTYSEAFYLLIQSAFLYYFSRQFIMKAGPIDKHLYVPVFVTVILLFLLYLTRNVGLVALIAVLVFFATQKKWKHTFYVIIVFGALYGIYALLKSWIWEIPDMQIAGQGSTLLLKNSFKPELGNETALGFLLRIIGNSVYYLGFHLFNIFGISTRDEFIINILVALIVYIIFFRGLFVFAKKSTFWLFAGIYLFVTIGVTFLVLQTYWNQERLIIVVAPLLLAFIFHTLHSHFEGKRKKNSWIFVMFLSLLLFANLFKTIRTVPEQVDVISHYLKGNDLYGYPQDWQTYLTMIKWVSKNLDNNAYVACRKPGMAFIYSKGKNFYGIWKIPSQDPEILYRQLKDAGVTHVVMASLRTNPDLEESTLINTVRHYLEIVNKAYPGKLKLIHQTGDKWPAYLYELN